MTIQEYNDILQDFTAKVDGLNDIAYKLGKQLVSGGLYKEDLVFCAFLNRSVNLTVGFSSMLEQKNLICAGSLLRLLLDNIIRLYAIFTAQDMHQAVECIMSGGRIDKLQDRNGKFMKDGYLKREIDKLDPLFSTVYDNTSGYIHFSDKTFYQAVNSCEESSEYDIQFHISTVLPDKFYPLLVECMDAYVHYTKLFYELMKQPIDVKENRKHLSINNGTSNLE